jgi:hypothetical protein
MNSVVMDTNGCDLAHETLMLKEFGEAVNRANPELHLAGKDAVGKSGKPARPGSKHATSAPGKVIDGVRSVLDFPKCP